MRVQLQTSSALGSEFAERSFGYKFPVFGFDWLNFSGALQQPLEI